MYVSSINISDPPIFTKALYFPLFRKIYYFPPIFPTFSLISSNLHVFCMLYVILSSPYFDHDAFMHQTMHILDAPARVPVSYTRASQTVGRHPQVGPRPLPRGS